MSEKTKITKTISKKVNMDAITYRRKRLSKTRTVDLKTLTSKLDNLDPEKHKIRITQKNLFAMKVFIFLSILSYTDFVITLTF